MNKELLQSLKIAVGCLKSGIKDPEIIADLEKTIHKGELRELFVEECRKGLKNGNTNGTNESRKKRD
jgi:hypothetical protein